MEITKNRQTEVSTDKKNVTKIVQRSQTQSRKANQPSVALGHFLFEFSKTVLSKAGGTISSSVYLNHMNHQQTGPHRNLHICSFLISLYALGLNNMCAPTWLMRTYSSFVTWVSSQAADIGYAAICILIGTNIYILAQIT